jgi:hypothetical protein
MMPPARSSLNSHDLGELLRRLHEANERFAAAKKELELQQACTDVDCPHVDGMTESLRQAERELEAIDAEVKSLLAAKPSPG